MPQVSLLSLPSRVISVKLDASVDSAGGEKQRIILSGEGLEILSS